MKMKQPTIQAIFIALFSMLLVFPLVAQSAGEVIVIEVSSFNTQKNFEIYALFNDDEEVDVINSCDALGWVVLRANNAALSKAMVRAYVDLKMLEVLDAGAYSVVEDKQAIDVLEDCRAEMLRQTEVE
jgi:hypothetical protein